MTASYSPEMDDLVERTRGVQPMRRLFHMLTGLVAAVALGWLEISQVTAVVTLAAIFAGLVFLDIVRLRLPRVNAAFFRAFRYLASPREATGLASSTWYALGLLLAVAFFPRPAAVTGTLVLALADPVASYLGQRFGRRAFLGGTVEGSLAFLGTSVLLLLTRHSPPTALVVGLVVTLVERISWPVDDNLTLPPATAAALVLLERLL